MSNSSQPLSATKLDQLFNPMSLSSSSHFPLHLTNPFLKFSPTHVLNHSKMKENTKKRIRNRSKKIRVSEEGDYFDCLPSELIMAIFDKILDVKCLCICTSVSKYFAAHVAQTRFVSVEICPTRKSPVCVWQPGPEVENFFKKLRCVESATIHYSLCNRNTSKSKRMPLVWWKSNSNGFILVASSNPNLPRWRKFRVDKWRFVFRSIQDNLLDFTELFYFTKKLLALLPNLKNISALDPLKQGRIVLEEEGIACTKRENPLEGRGKFCVRQWIAREVKLPLSGLVMENVVVILSREIGVSDGSVADNLLEENEYREVAATMMKKRAYSQSELPFVDERCTIADATYDILVFRDALAGPDFD